MKKTKLSKKRFMTIGALLILMMSMLLFPACTKEAPKEGIARIEEHLNIELPKEMEVEYHYYNFF